MNALELEHVTVAYRGPVGDFRAVDDISLAIANGESLGMVGESGCGKSSLARAVMMMPRPSHGSVRVAGVDLGSLDNRGLRRERRKFQMIFQDPRSSLHPMRRVSEIVGEPLRGDRSADKGELVRVMLTAVGLDEAELGGRRPAALSGGQAQRVAIARALMNEPDLLVCDEAVSALDASVQAQVLNLLSDVRARRSMAMLFISHDLGVVRHLSDRIAVMYLGRLAEIGPAESVYAHPRHPYTAALISAVPDPNGPRRRLITAEGEAPSPIRPPSGCRFRTRCPLADELCATSTPVLTEVEPGHQVACHRPLAVERLT